MKMLIDYLRPYRHLIVLVILSLSVSALSILVVSQSIRYMIDHGLVEQNIKNLSLATIYLLILVLLLAIGTTGRTYFISIVGEKVTADLKKAVHRKIMILSPEHFETAKSGSILSLITSDIAAIQELIRGTISVAMRNIIMFIGSIILLFIVNLKLTIIIFMIIPFIIFPIIAIARKTRAFQRKVQENLAIIAAAAEENITNVKMIQAYGRESFAINNFEKKLQKDLQFATKKIIQKSILITTVIVLCFSSVILVFWFGGQQVIANQMTSGELSSFIFLSILCASSAGSLIDLIQNVNKVSGIADKIQAFLSIKPIIVDKKSDIKSEQIKSFHKNHLEFKNVTFNYPSKPQITAINNVSFSVEAGKLTAIVGQSGAGKSTLIQLLLRFYNTKEGVILYNGENIIDLSLKNLRDNFAYVSQDSHIFSDTIYANITYGLKDISMQKVREVAEAAAIDFIDTLPDGFDTFVGEKGMRLSGGQKQRINIARALLHDPKILLLDEATSSLDNYNEQKVKRGLKSLMTKRTCLVIAHRLSTIITASKILVLHNGTLIEEGTHQDLLNAQGHYAKLLYNGELQVSQDTG